MEQPHVVVLFGATGDLSRRKLLPGLLHLFEAGLLRDCRIVGTSLDEVLLWQHVERQRRHGRRWPAGRSYLIARTLSRARQLLLGQLGVVWLQTTAEQAASWFDERVRRR